MPGSALDYVFKHPQRLAGALMRDPVDVWDTFRDRLVQKREYRRPPHRHIADPDWERHLHEALGVSFPCGSQTGLSDLWRTVIGEVRGQGIDVGPGSFCGFNDGDAALTRAIWCLIRHLRPHDIVETGVGHGFTSRIMLEALARNGAGHLYSIDRPPLDPAMRNRVGIAVGRDFSNYWTLIRNSSRRSLPGLLARLGTIDLFVHDSLHTERNVRFEIDRAWAVLKPGGALVIDDIDSNGGFQSFTRRFGGFKTLIAEAEPVKPDTRRFNQKGLFAILLKDAAL